MSEPINSGWEKFWKRACDLFWQACFEGFDIWKAKKIIVQKGKTDDKIKDDIDKSGVMDLQLPPS